MFKNTIKLIGSNFSTFWKLLLYKIIVIAIVVGLFCATLGYLNQLDQFQALTNSTLSLLSISNIASGPTIILEALGTFFECLYFFIIALATIFPGIFIYLLVLFFVILPYLWHLSDLATNESIFGYMSSQTKYGFTSSFIHRLNKQNSFSWCFTLTIAPFNILLFAGIVGITFLAQCGIVWSIFAPMFIAGWIMLYFSLKITLLGSWSSAITTSNCTTWQGFAKSLNAVSKNFLRIWSNALVFMFVFVLTFILTGPFGCVILLPLYCFVVSVLGMVVFFEHQGMRYYVDFNTIVSPKKLELIDKINKIKHII